MSGDAGALHGKTAATGSAQSELRFTRFGTTGGGALKTSWVVWVAWRWVDGFGGWLELLMLRHPDSYHSFLSCGFFGNDAKGKFVLAKSATIWSGNRHLYSGHLFFGGELFQRIPRFGQDGGNSPLPTFPRRVAGAVRPSWGQGLPSRNLNVEQWQNISFFGGWQRHGRHHAKVNVTGWFVIHCYLMLLESGMDDPYFSRIAHPQVGQSMVMQILELCNTACGFHPDPPYHISDETSMWELSRWQPPRVSHESLCSMPLYGQRHHHNCCHKSPRHQIFADHMPYHKHLVGHDLDPRVLIYTWNAFPKFAATICPWWNSIWVIDGFRGSLFAEIFFENMRQFRRPIRSKQNEQKSGVPDQNLVQF